MSDEHIKNRQPFRLSSGRIFSDDTLSRVRHRKFRARFKNLAKFVHPLKVLVFFLIIVSLAYIAIVQLQNLFYSTSYFEIKQITITGNQMVSRKEILKLTGVTPGINLMELNMGTIQNRIMLHPVIKNAVAQLDGLYTLSLHVTERHPIMYAKSGTAFLQIGEDGIILSADGFGDLDLPIITGLKLDGRTPGDSLEMHDGFIEARTWIKTLPISTMKDISEINFSSLSNPYIFLLTGEKIFPKNLNDFIARYDFLRALLDNLRKNNVEPDYLDMRAPNEIVVKPRQTTSAMKGSKKPVADG